MYENHDLYKISCKKHQPITNPTLILNVVQCSCFDCLGSDKTFVFMGRRYQWFLADAQNIKQNDEQWKVSSKTTIQCKMFNCRNLAPAANDLYTRKPGASLNLPESGYQNDVRKCGNVCSITAVSVPRPLPPLGERLPYLCGTRLTICLFLFLVFITTLRNRTLMRRVTSQLCAIKQNSDPKQQHEKCTPKYAVSWNKMSSCECLSPVHFAC